DACGSELKIDRATELIWNEIANCSRSKARVFGSYNRGATDLPPVEYQNRSRVTVQTLLPPDRHAPILGGERTVLCGVGSQLMENHSQRLTHLSLQYCVGTVNFSVAHRRIGCELTPDQV